ncbi:hypothetical protein VC83_01565 [Pseudogymnoascus destructans]|uniref:Uncharacterized protein n=2 Tax=Pseudogymnoascus destructans TaxID=655981 RepID=L8FZI3_PSED2|nr:uncharacterized protein VC83_01565 [Pseudogymnoascus destructans]ELR05939.1 hypothetical protein GMDG_07712 [Pseudogymnoascus destructans 20631-21]OAF61945.1 hypothetical protein VC83_01565 [Pseudogymnoascus destructans]
MLRGNIRPHVATALVVSLSKSKYRVYAAFPPRFNLFTFHATYTSTAKMTSQERHSLTASIAAKTDPSSAARALIAPAEEKLSTGSPESDIEGRLRPVWGSIIDVAADTDHQSQEPLVAVLRAVQQQIFANGASEVTVWGEKVKVCDLPLFGASVRDAWNRAPGTGSADDFSASQWQNINGFLARLTSLSPSTPAFDFSMFGLWTLRSAFEANEASLADVDAAKVWFKYAEEVLTKLSNEGKSFHAKVGASGGSYADKEWTGFNHQRLGVWQAARR